MVLQGAIAAGLLLIILFFIILLIPIVVIVIKSRKQTNDEQLLDLSPQKQRLSIGKFLFYYVIAVAIFLGILFFLSKDIVFM